MADTTDPITAQLDALAVERRGYEVRNLPDRIALVDEQIARIRKESGLSAATPPVKRAARKP